MARRCGCSRKCPHIVRGSDALLAPHKLDALAPIIPILIDAAHGYDADSLDLDPDCGVHGVVTLPNPVCSCSGERFSAVEFVRAVELLIRCNGNDPATLEFWPVPA